MITELMADKYYIEIFAVEKALPKAVPGVTLEQARKCHLEARLVGKSVVMVAVKVRISSPLSCVSYEGHTQCLYFLKSANYVKQLFGRYLMAYCGKALDSNLELFFFGTFGLQLSCLVWQLMLSVA